MEPPASTPTPLRVRSLLRTTGRPVWALTALWAVVLVLWSVLLPPFIAPDEPQHLDLALDAAAISPLEWIAPAADGMGPEVIAAMDALGYFGDEPEDPRAVRRRAVGGRTADAAPPPSARPTIAELRARTGGGELGLNQMAQHPPLHYRLVGGTLAALPGWEDLRVDVLLGLLRLVSVLWVAPLPLLLAWTARGLGGGRTAEAAAAASALAVPQLAHLGSVVTNDAPLYALAGVLAVLLAHVAAGDTSRRTALRVGGVLLLALLTKGLALFCIVGVVAAYLAAARRPAVGLGDAAVGLVLAGAVAALAAPWYLENLLVFGSVQPSVGAPAVPDVQGTPAAFAEIAWRTQVRTFWGRIGWAETGLSTTTSEVASAVLGVLVLAGWWRRDSLAVAALALPGTLVLVGMLLTAWAVFPDDGGIRGVAGRYFAVSLPGVLAIAGLGAERLAGRLAPVAPLAVLGGGSWLHLRTLDTALPHLWTDDGGVAEAVGAVRAWAPWPSDALDVASGLALGLLAVVVLAVLVDVRRTAVVGAAGATAQTSSEEQADRGREHVPA